MVSVCAFTLAADLGCAAKTDLFRMKDPVPVDYGDQAARSGLAVLSVATWDEYVASLQPSFTMTSDRALDQALPITLRQQSEVMDALTFGVRLAPPTSATSSTTTTSVGGGTSNQSSAQNTATLSAIGTATSTTPSVSTQTNTETGTISQSAGANGASSTQSTTTATRQAGDVSKVTAAALPGLPTALTPGTSPLNGAIDTDPMTRYSAATALFQEVQLLNRYVRDAALKSNSRALVVRLHVTLLPQLRAQAYDAYSMLSFMFSDPQMVTTPFMRSEPRKPNQTATSLDPIVNSALQRMEAFTTVVSDRRNTWGVPTVVPLLVTDSLEQSAGSQSISQLRGFALALQALNRGVGVSADLERQLESLQAAIGEDSNSLLTVSKVATNALRVRFGAAHQIGSGLAMVPRNHTVTVLVLVPNDKNLDTRDSVTVFSKLELVRATDGVQLNDRPFSEVEKAVDATVCQYVAGCTPQIAPPIRAAAGRLAYAVMAEQQADFNLAAAELQIAPNARVRLWTDLLDVVSRSPYTTTVFYIPGAPRTPSFPSEEQLVSAIDDGTKTSIDLRGLTGDLRSSLVGSLKVWKPSAETAFLSTSVDTSSNVTHLSFPSIQKTKFCESATCTLELEVYWTNSTDRWSATPPTHTIVPGTFKTVLVSVPTEKPKKENVFFALSSGTHEIVRAKTGTGKLRLTIQRDNEHATEDMLFTVDGADVTTVEPPSVVTLGPKGYQVKPSDPLNPVVVTITFENLTENTDIRIVPANEKAEGEARVFRVRTQS